MCNKKTFALFAIMMLLASSIHATIHLTVVNHDLEYGDQLYDMDLNGDDDFYFYEGTSYYAVSSICPSCYYAAVQGQFTPKAYSAGAGLGSTYNWTDFQGSLEINFGSADKYLMVRFDVGSYTYYGWFLITSSVNGTLVVYEYAWNDVPGETIKAGETSFTGINNIPTLSNVVQINQNQVSFQNCEGFDKVNLYTTDGRIIAEINNPIAHHSYSIQLQNSIVLVAFIKKEKLLFSNKYFVHQQ